MLQALKTTLIKVMTPTQNKTPMSAQEARELEAKFAALKNEADESGRPGDRILRAKQHEVASAVARQAQTHADRIRLGIQAQADEEDLQASRKIFQTAIKKEAATLEANQKQQFVIETRLNALRLRMSEEMALAQTRLEAAQQAFDEAMTSGNESAEASAAEALSAAKKQADPQTLKGTPFDLRVTALEKELDAGNAGTEAIKQALSAAQNSIFEIDRSLCQLQHDGRVRDLIDLHVNHNAKTPRDYAVNFKDSEILIFSKDRFIQGSWFRDWNRLDLGLSVANISKTLDPIDTSVLLESIPDETGDGIKNEAAELAAPEAA